MPRQRPAALWAAIAIAASCTLLSGAASRHTSATFDEILFMAGGARGYETGSFDTAPEHPPLPQYLYGLPIWLTQPGFPPHGTAPEWGRGVPDLSFRYGYARAFFWESGNDPERLALLGRSVGAVLAGALVFAVFAWTRRGFGDGAGLLAALLVALLPDVLAHGGVAYNDLPFALGYLLALWSLDAAVREPSPKRGAVAGVCAALALAIKLSAVVLAPLVLLLIAAEFVGRRDDAEWRRRMRSTGLAILAAAYLGLVVVYRGDLSLSEMRYAVSFTFGQVTTGHTAPGYLLGEVSATGWWYFFPVVFFLKTPAALHLLMLTSLAAIARASSSSRYTDLLRSPLRAPAFGLLVLGAALISSSLAIGFRYALPALPLICILVAAWISSLWAGMRMKFRAALGAVVLWYAASSLSFYPHFLAFTSEYGPGRDRGGEVLVDSSLDWGQGLLALREWMREEKVDRVYLSYFGSAVPAGYGISYVPLPSFFPLPAVALPSAAEPRYAVVSATNLQGLYLQGDPFVALRTRRPETVLAHSLNVYRIDGDSGRDGAASR